MGAVQSGPPMQCHVASVPSWPTSPCQPTFAVLLCSANLSAKDIRTSACCVCMCPGSQDSKLLLWLSSLSKQACGLPLGSAEGWLCLYSQGSTN